MVLNGDRLNCSFQILSPTPTELSMPEQPKVIGAERIIQQAAGSLHSAHSRRPPQSV